MALVTQPADGLWTSNLKNNARQGRAMLQAFLENADATPMNGTRSGVIVTTGAAADLLPFGVAGLSVSINPGTGVAHKAGQGPLMGWLTSVKTVTTTNAPASNPRNDLIVMRMYDLAAGDISPDGEPCRIEVITGTPAASPTDPIAVNALGVYTGIPAQAGLGTGGIAIPIARAQVSTGGVITLSDLRRSAGVVGGPRYMLPADAGSTDGRTGQLRYTPTTDLLEIKDSAGNWQRVISGSRAPRGLIAAPAIPAGTGACTTGETIQTETATGNVVSGRRYEITHTQQFTLTGGAATAQTYRYRVAAGASVTTGGTLIRELVGPPPSGAWQTYTRVLSWLATFTGQATFGVGWFYNGSGVGSAAGSAREFSVRDIGDV